jgi:hypothetical protein
MWAIRSGTASTRLSTIQPAAASTARSRRATPTSPRRRRTPSSSPGTVSRSSNKSELKEFRDMLVGVRENVATLRRQGRTRDEIVAAKPTAAYDAKFGAFVIDPGFFTRLVYEGV